jgi:transcriptional regulator with XRE-family HTH domain
MKSTTVSKQDMDKIYKKIGENVKKARKAKNISQLTLALAIGHKAVGTISMAELCINNKHFNIEHLVKIANVLDMKVEDFFQGIQI